MAAVDTLPESGAVPILLATITTRVDVYRVASEPIEVAWADGDGPIQFHPGLRGLSDLQAEIDLFDLEYQSAVDSARLRVVLPGSVSGSVAQGKYYGLAAATVEIASIWRGQDFASRVVLLDGGRVTGLNTGRADEQTEFYVESRAPAAGASAVDASRDLGVTYPKGSGPYPDLSGKQFPIVVGRVYGVPLFRVGTSQTGGKHSGIIAGHKLAPNVAIGDINTYSGKAEHTFVSVLGLTFPQGGPAAPLTSPILGNGTDPDGNPVSWVEVSTSQLLSSSEPYTCDLTTGGVASVRDSSRAAVGLGEVLEWLLVNSGVKADILAQSRTTRLLAGWEGGVYLDRYADLIDVVRQRLLPFLPLVERTSARGMFYQFADPRIAPLEFSLTLGQELVAPVGGISLTDIDAVRNSFYLEYGYMHSTGSYAGRLSLGASDLECCRYSQQEFGEVADKPLRCSITWDQATARRILQSRAERLSLPRRGVTYTVDPSVTWLREGMVGTITDTERGIVAHRAVLRRWRPTGLPWRASFELVDRPPVSRL